MEQLQQQMRVDKDQAVADVQRAAEAKFEQAHA
jgi:hypothetical protein